MAALSVRVIIEGRVQGVGYRAWCAGTARGLKLKGWVRNLSDGTVEALFYGDELSISRMLAACKQGPIAARVSGIAQFPSDEKPEGSFETRPTI